MLISYTILYRNKEVVMFTKVDKKVFVM